MLSLERCRDSALICGRESLEPVWLLRMSYPKPSFSCRGIETVVEDDDDDVG